MTPVRRLGWVALAVGVAAVVAIVPPLLLPSAPPAAAPSPSPPSPTASAPPAAPSPSPPSPATSAPAAAPSPSPPSPAASAPARPSRGAPPAFAPILVHAADRANLRTGARVIECPTCDGGSRVGYIGGPNTLAIRVSEVPAAGERTLVVVYETEALRTLKVAVADGPVHTLTLAGAGDYRIPARTSLTVFLPAGSTWIRCFNDAGDAPDINRIELR